MIDFKQFYRNGKGWMFWNTFMLFLNYIQVPKKKYTESKIREFSKKIDKVKEGEIFINNL